MSADDAALLAALPGHAFAFVMVLARVGSAVMLLPGFGEAEVPMPVRAALAVALTLLLLPVVAPLLPPEPGDGLRALLGVAGEVVAGLWLGWLARLLVLALPMAAQLAAGMIGLANVLQPDAALGPQTSALARLFALAAPVAIMATGLHALPLVDTLLLSPIAFPQNPYHRLVKDYKLVSTARSDPVADAELSFTLFGEQCACTHRWTNTITG